MTEFFDAGIAGSTAYIRPMEGAYLTGAALYRAMADMLDGGREVQMAHGVQCGQFKETDWSEAFDIRDAYVYRLKPAFGHVVQQKRDLEAEVKRLRELLAAAYKMVPQQRHEA